MYYFNICVFINVILSKYDFYQPVLGLYYHPQKVEHTVHTTMIRKSETEN